MLYKCTTSYSHNGIKGCVSQTRCRASGTTIGIYHAVQAMLDDAGGPWVTFCENHGCLCNHESLARARRHAAYPEWCEDCQHEIRKREVAREMREARR